jgi:hypothetical protein
MHGKYQGHNEELTWEGGRRGRRGREIAYQLTRIDSSSTKMVKLSGFLVRFLFKQ